MESKDFEELLNSENVPTPFWWSKRWAPDSGWDICKEALRKELSSFEIRGITITLIEDGLGLLGDIAFWDFIFLINGEFFSLSAERSSWLDDHCFGEYGGGIRKLKPVKKLVTVYEVV